jgi:hypothetical protein
VRIITLTKHIPKIDRAVPIGTGAPEITVTREMREAGESVFETVWESYAIGDVVEAVYTAMRCLEPDQITFVPRDIRRSNQKR